MTVNEAVRVTAQAVIDGSISTSDTDIRCCMNDLLPYDTEYNQTYAIRRVKNLVQHSKT